jgi:alpha-L-fucosidase
MAVNGRSVYDTRANPLGAVKWGRITADGGRLYLHVFDWPKDGRLVVPGAKAEVLKAHLLADRKVEYKVTAGEGAVVVEVPAKAPDSVDTVIVLTLGKA